MKKLSFSALILVFMIGNVFSQNSVIKIIFDSHADDDNFESVFVSGKMFESLSESKGKDKTANMTSVLKGINILKTSKNVNAFFKEVKQKLSNANLEEYLRVKENDRNVIIFTKANPDDINLEEVILLIKSTDETVLISFSGDIDINEISKLRGSFK